MTCGIKPLRVALSTQFRRPSGVFPVDEDTETQYCSNSAQISGAPRLAISPDMPQPKVTA